MVVLIFWVYAVHLPHASEKAQKPPQTVLGNHRWKVNLPNTVYSQRLFVKTISETVLCAIVPHAIYS